MRGPAPLSDSDALHRAPSTLDTRTGDTTLLLCLDSDVSLELNASGSRIWDMLQEPTTFGTLITRLGTLYAAEETRIRSEVGALLEVLQRNGMVSVERRT